MQQLRKLPRTVISSGLATIVLLSGQATAENPGGWEFSVAPLYLWGKNLEGSATVGGKEAPLDLDFKDQILENLEAAFSVHAEAKQGALTLFAEYNYAKLSPSAEESFGPVTVEADVDFKDTMWELGVAYEVVNTGNTQVEVLGGVRYMDQDVDIKIDGPAPTEGPIPDRVAGGDDWWHGFGGLRTATKISENWQFRVRADMGYKNSSNKSGHVFATFDYRFRDWGSFFAGYRYLDTEYDNKKSGANGYAANNDQKGPLLGVNFYF